MQSHRNLYGNVLNTLAINEFTLTETDYDGQLELPEHSHDFAYFCLVLNGSYRELYGRRDRHCVPSMLIFHPSGESHSNRFDGAGGRCFNIQFSQSWLTRMKEHSSFLESPADFKASAAVNIAIRIRRESHSIDDFSGLVVEGLALELLAEASRSQRQKTDRRPPRWVEQAREIIHTDFAERLTLTDIADLLGVHPVHLARSFRRHYRATVGEYLRQTRIAQASQRLAHSDEPLAMIAAACGFSDQGHFSKAFKLSTGQTPAEYRRVSRLR
jgi:AraC family transcriptional regulator